MKSGRYVSASLVALLAALGCESLLRDSGELENPSAPRSVPELDRRQSHAPSR